MKRKLKALERLKKKKKNKAKQTTHPCDVTDDE